MLVFHVCAAYIKVHHGTGDDVGALCVLRAITQSFVFAEHGRLPRDHGVSHNIPESRVHYGQAHGWNFERVTGTWIKRKIAAAESTVACIGHNNTV